MEESQHAKLDGLMVEALADGRSLDARERDIDAYLSIGKLLDDGVRAQVDLNLAALERPADRATFREVQLQANRWNYLGSGMRGQMRAQAIRLSRSEPCSHRPP